MQVSSVQSYNSQTKINKNNSFKSLEIPPDFSHSELFRHIDSSGIESITQRLINLANATFNLREIIKLAPPTVQKEKMLNRLFDSIGKKEVANLTVHMVPFLNRWNPEESRGNSVYDNGVDFKIYLPDSEEVTIDSISWTSGFKNSVPTAINYDRRVKRYGDGYEKLEIPIMFNPNGSCMLKGLFYAIPTVEMISQSISKAINDKINEMCTKEDAVIETVHKSEALNKLRILAQKTGNGRDPAETIEIPAEDILPVDSAVCTLEDINNYIIEHAAEIDYGRIFNKPVTKDGESLLTTLVLIMPTKANKELYIKLVKSMRKMPLIDYNQKDKSGVPAIAYVLLSQNGLLFAAFCNCKELEYEPALESEFSNITDSAFRSAVLNSRIFENAKNVEYETIFGMPNPLYIGQ